MFSRNLSSIYIACICVVLAFIEERRCQIMIGLWQYVISEMGFEIPRDVEVNGFRLSFCNCTNLFVRRSKEVAESIE